jgi:DNA processing protein
MTIFAGMTIFMKYLNALNRIEGIGAQKLRLLMTFFGEAEKAWRADLANLQKSGIGNFASEQIIQQRKNIDPDTEWEKMEKENIRLIDWESSDYPALLREINNPPYLLYVKGNLDLNSAPIISIVGSRKYTQYGKQVAENFSRELAHAGIIVASGMAIGIDSFAHRGALDAGGKTVAVLADSLDDNHIHPRINFNMSREILENGLLVSEYPVPTESLPVLFPARNRIVAGLSLGTLIVEAEEKSGSLITATLALEFNREVFAVPGSVFSPQSFGTNDLIKKGAKVVTSVKDILEELNLGKIEKNNQNFLKIPENKEEEILLKILSTDPLHIDNIAKISKLGTVSTLSTLSMMELKGWAKNIGGQNYIKL